MIERDGWCYPDDPQPMLQIVAADRLGDYRLMVTFNDGEKRIFDGHSLLDGPVFAPLADEKDRSIYGAITPSGRFLFRCRV